jgi:ribosome recycling factor
MLPDDERKELIGALKKKWEVVHKQYQEITHVQKMDTIGLRKKKEGCEAELAQLEKDIDRLSKNYIFVDTAAPSSYY